VKILVFIDYYLPGYRAGGPIRTLLNMVDILGDEFNFSLVTRDCDLGDSMSYEGIAANNWLPVGKARVYYISSSNFLKNTFKIIGDFQGEVLYFNSFFSLKFSILPLLIARFYGLNLSVVIGPRGEFSSGALSLKTFKKKSYIFISKALGVYKNVIWHASTAHEADDIVRVIGVGANIKIANDIAVPAQKIAISVRTSSRPLRVIFLSRISPMKNLSAAFDILKKVSASVVFDVYGPIEDKHYWSECQLHGSSLPNNITYQYRGEVFPAQVPDMLSKYDLFFLPTLGENFGHVIAEALSSGLPVLISDKTPWRNLAKKRLGWDLPLHKPDLFAAAIDECANMAALDYDNWRRNIRAWALKNIGNDESIEQNRQLFNGLK
jgi:glycosyltransferase involved in cell wall biosynthesis